MSEANPEDLTARVAQLEKKLEASLTVIRNLVQALDYMRDGDARFIFEMGLVKHSLCVKRDIQNQHRNHKSLIRPHLR